MDRRQPSITRGVPWQPLASGSLQLASGCVFDPGEKVVSLLDFSTFWGMCCLDLQQASA